MAQRPCTQRLSVSGGAGFVGSHNVAAGYNRGDEVGVLLNRNTGHRAEAPLVLWREADPDGYGP